MVQPGLCGNQVCCKTKIKRQDNWFDVWWHPKSNKINNVLNIFIGFSFKEDFSIFNIYEWYYLSIFLFLCWIFIFMIHKLSYLLLTVNTKINVCFQVSISDDGSSIHPNLFLCFSRSDCCETGAVGECIQYPAWVFRSYQSSCLFSDPIHPHLSAHNHCVIQGKNPCNCAQNLQGNNTFATLNITLNGRNKPRDCCTF